MECLRELISFPNPFRILTKATIEFAEHLPPFEKADLVKNYATLADAILRAKPSSAKGTFVKSVYLSTTMGPGIKLDPKTFAAEVKELV